MSFQIFGVIITTFQQNLAEDNGDASCVYVIECIEVGYGPSPVSSVCLSPPLNTMSQVKSW